MSRPSFQFYPDDWRANSNLRRCSWTARGVWLEVMCLMHDRDRYGTLDWTLKEIAQALGCQMAPLTELVAKGVMKGCDSGPCPELVYTPRSGRRNGTPVVLIEAQSGPIWFSSRMVKDEHIRSSAGASTRFGQGTKPDTSPEHSPTPRHSPDASPSRRQGEGQSDGSTSSSPSPPSGEERTSLRSVASQAPPAPRGARLPKDWQPQTAERDMARTLGLDCNAVLERFRDFWVAKPGKDGVKLDWDATFRNWLRNEGPRGRSAPLMKPKSATAQWADLMRGDAPAFDLDGSAEEIPH